MHQYADKVIITNEWFKPHFPARKDRPLEVAMCEAWKISMSYEDYYGSVWSSRIANMLARIPRALNKRGARVATTFALWLVTNNGRGFLIKLYKEQNEKPSFSDSDTLAVRSWADENKLSSGVRNTLEGILCNEKGLHVYTNPAYPTLEDNRVIESTLCFFLSDQGKNLIKTVYNKDDWGDSLPFKE